MAMGMPENGHVHAATQEVGAVAAQNGSGLHCEAPAVAAAAPENGDEGAKSDAASTDVGMIRKVVRDDRRRRSIAYRFTQPFNGVGGEPDMRACILCGAVFSFRTGTTSAALRHFKSVHPQEVFESSTLTQPADEPVVDVHEVAQDAPAAEEFVAAPEPPTEEEMKARMLRQMRGVLNKRRRFDDEHAPSATYAPLRFEANRAAIAHFLKHYKPLMTVPMQLAFIKHITYHDREAEMYNVLDDETRFEYLRQFAESAGDEQAAVEAAPTTIQ